MSDRDLYLQKWQGLKFESVLIVPRFVIVWCIPLDETKCTHNVLNQLARLISWSFQSCRSIEQLSKAADGIKEDETRRTEWVKFEDCNPIPTDYKATIFPAAPRANLAQHCALYCNCNCWCLSECHVQLLSPSCLQERSKFNLLTLSLLLQWSRAFGILYVFWIDRPSASVVVCQRSILLCNHQKRRKNRRSYIIVI